MNERHPDVPEQRVSESVQAAKRQSRIVLAHPRSRPERPVAFNREQSEGNQAIAKDQTGTPSPVTLSHLITSYADYEELRQDLMGEEDEFRGAQATTSASFTGAEISDSRLVSDNDGHPHDPGRTVCCPRCFPGLSHDLCPW